MLKRKKGQIVKDPVVKWRNVGFICVLQTSTTKDINFVNSMLAPIVLLAGLRQRFCQQCSRFHEVSEFDGTKRSCRRHLAGHNERRRKTPLAIKLEDNQCRQMNEENRQQKTLTNRNASFKTYHIL